MLLGLTIVVVSSLNASDLFTCKGIGHVDLSSKKFIQAKREAYLKIIPSEKRNYIYYSNGDNGRSEAKYMSFEDGNFKYYAMQGGYVGFNEGGMSAVVLVPEQQAVIIYKNCEKSDSIEAFAKDAEGLINAAKNARRLNDSMKLH